MDRLLATMRSLLRRRTFEADLEAELQDHLARDIEHRVARGASPAEARRAALAELGGVGRVKDDVREAHGIEHVDGFFRDLRFAVRRVRRAPHYSGLVILTIGLGVAMSLSAATGLVVVLALLAATLPTLRAARANPARNPARALGEDAP